jgi:hypothetical protein
LADMTFDETYNIREAVDFLADKLGVRERLIQSARQFSEKSGGQRFSITVKRFEDLYADFLRLYQPVFERITAHKEAIQKEISSQRDALTGVVGMIQVAKGVEVLADKVRELESEAKGIESGINEKTKTLEKIDELLSRARHQAPELPKQSRDEDLGLSDQSDDFLTDIRESGAKSGTSRKSSSRN